jgi:hypothetical protein
MLDGLKRWFAKGPAPEVPADELEAWAQARQYTFRGVRDGGGFAIDGRLGALPWRIEWGAPQRPYLRGCELRLRAELGLPPDVQAMVLDRTLQEAMEKSMYEQYIEGVQTRIDDRVPPEMRWLVMFPKLAGDEMRTLRDRFAVVGSREDWLRLWLEGPLTEALRAAPLAAGRPFVLIIARGRLTLRTALDAPEPSDLQRWLRLFETAIREARRTASQAADASAPSTQPSLWSASSLPIESRPQT